MGEVIDFDNDPGIVLVRMGGKEISVDVLAEINDQEAVLAPMRDDGGKIKKEFEEKWIAALVEHVKKKFDVVMSGPAVVVFREKLTAMQKEIVDFFFPTPVSLADSGLTHDGSLTDSEEGCSQPLAE